jgi:serine/threonine protein kinase
LWNGTTLNVLHLRSIQQGSFALSRGTFTNQNLLASRVLIALLQFSPEQLGMHPHVSLGDYIRVRNLGAGATADVFQVEAANGQIYALKYVLENGDRQTVETEREILSKMQDVPGVPRVVGHGDNYLVLSPVGQPQIAALTPVMINRLFSIILECRNRQIVHRDIRPVNLICAIVNNADSLFLIDWGYAAERRDDYAIDFEGSQSTASDRIIGLMVANPEQQCHQNMMMTLKVQSSLATCWTMD